jgi:hypothetical protein
MPIRADANAVRPPAKRGVLAAIGIAAYRPDAVMAGESLVPRITGFPAYLITHGRKALFPEQPVRMRNLLSVGG